MEFDLNDIAVFTAVVASGRFSAAGRTLGIPASSVSRRVACLERALGFKLLHRTTRRVGLTESGRVYYEGTSDITQRLEAARRAVDDMHALPSGLVRVTAPPDDGG